MRSLYSYRDYKTYLKESIEAKPDSGRGVRSALARAASCQTAYVSQVLGGSAHFSLEQAEAISRYLGHNPSEAHYFLLLLQYTRAGTATLRSYFLKQLESAAESRLSLKERLGVGQLLTLESQAIYYSAWYYAAIHVLISVPGYQSAESIGAALRLSLAKVTEVLGFLVSVGLAKSVGHEFRSGTARIHLGHDSPLISKHHINWRLQAIQSLESAISGSESGHLHYSSAVSLSRKDLETIRTLLVECIEKAKTVVKESREETIYCFTVDFFSLLRGS